MRRWGHLAQRGGPAQPGECHQRQHSAEVGQWRGIAAWGAGRRLVRRWWPGGYFPAYPSRSQPRPPNRDKET